MTTRRSFLDWLLHRPWVYRVTHRFTHKPPTTPAPTINSEAWFGPGGVECDKPTYERVVASTPAPSAEGA